MVKTFIQEKAANLDLLLQIDTESGNVKTYAVDKELSFPFAEYYSTFSEMGYISTNEMIEDLEKDDARKEVDTTEQIKKEINGLLSLVKYRTEYNDIVECLKSYGLSEAEATAKVTNAVETSSM